MSGIVFQALSTFSHLTISTNVHSLSYFHSINKEPEGLARDSVTFPRSESW